MHHYPQHYPWYPQQTGSPQSKIPYRVNIPYGQQSLQQLQQQQPSRPNSNNANLPLHHLTRLASTSSLHVNPRNRSVRYNYLNPAAQRVQKSSNKRNQRLVVDDPRANCLPQERHNTLLQPALQPYFVRLPVSNELLYPSRYPSLVYIPLGCRINENTVTPISRESNTHESARPKNDDDKGIRVCHQPTTGHESKLQEPRPADPLVSKHTRQASATLSGVSTATSTSDQQTGIYNELCPAFRRVPCLNKNNNNNNRDNPLIDDKTHEQNERVARRVLSETYKRRNNGTWIGLGINERKEDDRTGQARNSIEKEGLMEINRQETSVNSLVTVLNNLKKQAVNLMCRKMPTAKEPEKENAKENAYSAFSAKTNIKNVISIKDETGIDFYDGRPQTARQRKQIKENTVKYKGPKSTEITSPTMVKYKNYIDKSPLTKNMFDRSPDLFLSSTSSSSLTIPEDRVLPPKLPLLKLQGTKKTKKVVCKTARQVGFLYQMETTSVSTAGSTENDETTILGETRSRGKEEKIKNFGSMTERGCWGKQELRDRSWLPDKRIKITRNANIKNTRNSYNEDVTDCQNSSTVDRYKRWLIRNQQFPEYLFMPLKDLEFKSQRESNGRKEEINNGTFCTVYKARYKGADVAVKCPLQQQIKADPDMANLRAIKEIHLLSRASNHMNILKLYGSVILSKEEIWIVTEFVPGGDLYTKLYHDSMDRRLTPANRLKIMLQLSSALSFLHNLEPKIVHKDLKCNNILVDDNADIRLCDFGDAEEIRSGEGLKYYTAVTWQYAPPEIILSKDPSHPERHCNESVDIWSLGCILLELCYEPTPFWHILERVDPSNHHLTLQNYLNKIIGGNGPFHYNRQHNRGGFKDGHFFLQSHCLAVLIEWCLNFDASSRPTAKQVYVYLLQFRSNLIKELTELEEARKRRDSKKRKQI